MDLLAGGAGSAHLVPPACVALGHAFLGGPLPLNDRGTPTEEGEGLSKTRLIDRLRKLLTDTKDMRVSVMCGHVRTGVVM